MKVILEFKNSHHYEREYEKTEYYCPLCGKQDIWEEQGPGDYYQGPDYLCVNCNSSHSLIHSSGCEGACANVASQIKSNTTATPTTKRGK